MGNYYEILEIEKTSDMGEVRRAYFKKVRQYPPERFPEEFKNIRAAYETLSDEEKRAEYDKSASLPPEAAVLLESASNASLRGKFKQAEALLKTASENFPGLNVIKAGLARLYVKEGKNGKAASIWEELCTIEPDNAEYCLELANLYKLRGWRKKAIERYNRALSLNSTSVNAWMEIIKCHIEAGEYGEVIKLCSEADEAANGMGSEKFLLYCLMFSVVINLDIKLAEEYLQSAGQTMREFPVMAQKEGETYISLMLDRIMSTSNSHMLPHIRQMAELLPNKSESLCVMLEDAGLIYEIKTIEDKGFSVLFHDLFATIFNECDCEDCRLTIAAMEYNILAEPKVYRPQLLRMKKEYPLLYKMHASFFDTALITSDTEKMIYKRLKMLSKNGLAPMDYLGEQDDDWLTEPQTVRRESPKIGRNDPCPCGSGKKYKRCCGS